MDVKEINKARKIINDIEIYNYFIICFMVFSITFIILKLSFLYISLMLVCVFITVLAKIFYIEDFLKND